MLAAPFRLEMEKFSGLNWKNYFIRGDMMGVKEKRQKRTINAKKNIQNNI